MEFSAMLLPGGLFFMPGSLLEKILYYILSAVINKTLTACLHFSISLLLYVFLCLVPHGLLFSYNLLFHLYFLFNSVPRQFLPNGSYPLEAAV